MKVSIRTGLLIAVWLIGTIIAAVTTNNVVIVGWVTIPLFIVAVISITFDYFQRRNK